MKKILSIVFVTVIFICISLYMYTHFVPRSGTLVLPNKPSIVKPGTKVILDGNLNNIEKGTLTHYWSFYSLPEKSNARLSDPNTTRPTFIADIPGDYFIGLNVNNDQGNTIEKGYIVYAYDFLFNNNGMPIKIPPRVTIQRSTPEKVYANDNNEQLELRFILSKNVPEGAVIQLDSERHKLSFRKYYIKTGNEVKLPHISGNMFKVPEHLSAGSMIIVTFHDICFPISGRKCFFLEHIDNDDDQKKQFLKKHIKMNYQFHLNPQTIIGACLINVEGGETDHIRAYAPSQVIINKPFSILVRPEDKSNNLSRQGVESIKIDAENTSWEPECIKNSVSTSCNVTVSISKKGVYRLNIVDKSSGKSVMTNPFVCKEAPDKYKTYWGVIHGHSEMSWDATGSLDHYYLQMRDEAALDFAASSEHCNILSTPDVLWERISRKVREYNKPGEFVTFLGYEWDNWLGDGNGDLCAYYLNDSAPMYRSLYYTERTDLFNVLRKSNEAVIAIPHHTAEASSYCNWKNHAPEFERLVEIFQVRGSYECSVENGNLLHPKAISFPHGYVQDALGRGWRVGFAAGGDDHSGTAGIVGMKDLWTKDGVMGVLATDLTREALWDALYNRRVVATTGERVLLNYDLNGSPMGSELDTTTMPDLAAKRRLHIAFHGTAPVEKLQIIRNNKIVHSITGNGLDLETYWEDNIPINEISMTPNQFSPNPYIFYYIRVIQKDHEMAWASPIWIDIK